MKIKAKANPYDRIYAGYIWFRLNQKESGILPALSAREYRAVLAN